MIRPFRPLLLICALLLLAGPARAAEEDDPRTGLAVGKKAPAFTLKDQEGKEHALADLLKKGQVALVFHRSARW